MIDEQRPDGPYGHVCWAYDDPITFRRHAEAYLTAGLAAGERVWYVTPDEPESVLARLRRVGVLADALRRGAAEVVPLDSTYAGDRTVDPAAQVAAYAAATDRALAAGHTGLRVVAEATALVRTPAQLDAFARYEHQIDRYMRARPFRAMCAYHRPELGARTVAELASLHPESNVEDLLFRLYAVAPGEGHAALAGELDPSQHKLFGTALARADLRPTEGELVLRATGLRFLDHRSLVHLDEYAHRRSATAVLRTSRPAVARLVGLLDLPSLRVEVTR
ncbi:MEDS domain-containing protein [Micromonospora echinaurantiaca]|uniref:MEDS domain-containing protein n=1 Tax=Micromonospora echinaurantiaca TaxID=47857 RepID=UPI003717BD69